MLLRLLADLQCNSIPGQVVDNMGLLAQGLSCSLLPATLGRFQLSCMLLRLLADLQCTSMIGTAMHM